MTEILCAAQQKMNCLRFAVERKYPQKINCRSSFLFVRNTLGDARKRLFYGDSRKRLF